MPFEIVVAAVIAEDVETFRNAVGNQNEVFEAAKNEKLQVLVDFEIVTGR